MIETRSEYTGFWWDPARPEEKWAGPLVLSGDGFSLKLTLPPQGLTAAFTATLKEYEVLHGLTDRGEQLSLLHCFDRRHNEIFANAAIVGLHSASDDPPIARVAVTIDNLDVWWGRGGIRPTLDSQGRLQAIGYEESAPLLVHDDSEFTVTVRSGLSSSLSAERASMQDEIRIEISASHPRPLSHFRQQVHACQDLLSVACLSVCAVRQFRMVPPPEPDQRLTAATFHANPIFRANLADRPTAWPDLLFRKSDITSKATQVFGGWLTAAPELQGARSLYLAACYGESFLENKLLTLAQAAEAFHRRDTPNDLYMVPDEYQRTVFQPLVDAIPTNLDSSLRQSLKNRLKYGNEVSFSRRLTELFREHHTALEQVVPTPLDWVRRIVDYRNTYTHHPVLEQRTELDREDLLRCIYVLRMLLEMCFLKTMSIAGDDAVQLARRCEKYRQIKDRFFR